MHLMVIWSFCKSNEDFFFVFFFFHAMERKRRFGVHVDVDVVIYIICSHKIWILLLDTYICICIMFLLTTYARLLSVFY
jgi:hypothetical protein